MFFKKNKQEEEETPSSDIFEKYDIIEPVYFKEKVSTAFDEIDYFEYGIILKTYTDTIQLTLLTDKGACYVFEWMAFKHADINTGNYIKQKTFKKLYKMAKKKELEWLIKDESIIKNDIKELKKEILKLK